MTQNQTAATATPTATEMENRFENARNAASSAMIIACNRRDALREQMVALQEQLALAERMVDEAGEAYTILSRISDEEVERACFEDDDADADAYFKAQGEDYRDEDYASLARDEAYASGAWSS